MYSAATKSWWVLHSWLIEDPLWDDPGSLHNRISERSWILLSDMNGQISNTTLYQISHQLTTFPSWIDPHYWTPPLEFVIERKQRWENPTCEGRLICPEGHVSSLNKCNPIQSLHRYWISTNKIPNIYNNEIPRQIVTTDIWGNYYTIDEDKTCKIDGIKIVFHNRIKSRLHNKKAE